MASEANTVVVIGAGMVGVACALELQRRGFQVTLVDRKSPGKETSYGNAGVLARSSLMPFNNPGLWALLPKLLKNTSAQFRYNPLFLARNAAWALGFLARARRQVFEETVAALDALILLSIAEHKRLLGEARAAHRLRDNGWLYLYRSEEAFAGGALARATYARFQIDTETLDGRQLSELEPSLSPIFQRALWIKDTASVDSPGAVVEAYAGLFSARGGIILRSDVRSLTRHGSDWCAADTQGAAIVARQAVMALGPWAKDFLHGVGLSVPMAFERGYHMHYAAPGGMALGRPVYDTGGAYVLSPMEQGLRLTTGVELTDRDAAKNPVQLTLAEQAARHAFPLGARLESEPWLGCRPTLPDSRPAIGAAPGRPGLWLAFGHQHIGFSTGPGTAALLASLMMGERAPINAAAFDPARFVS